MVALLIFLIAAMIVATPVAWLLMLLVGNLGINLDFLGAYPGGLLVGILAGGSGRVSTDKQTV